MLLERSFIAIEQGNSRFSLGILEFPTMSSPSLAGGSLGNSKFLCDEIIGSSRGMTTRKAGDDGILDGISNGIASLRSQ